MKDHFLETAYKFYPRNIYGLDDAYMLSKEIQYLKSTLESNFKLNYDKWIELIDYFNSSQNSYKAIDKSSFIINQPSLSLQIILEKNNNPRKILSIYFSMLIPYYYFITQIDNSDSMDEIINENKDLSKDINNFIEDIKRNFNLNLIPDSYLEQVIPDISFETINFKNFTVKNAYFNKKNIII